METKPKRSREALVLRAPWVELASECACRFFLAGVLCAGDILGGCSPFAPGFIAASGPGAGGFFALIGAILGYLLALPLSLAFRYIATAILIYAIAFAFYDLKLYTTKAFMPCCAAAMAALTGFVYLAEAGWELSGLIAFFTEVLLTGLYARVFLLAAQSPPQPIPLLFTAGALMIALETLPLPFGLSLGAALGAGLVVWCGRTLGGLPCVTAAVTLGLCLDLSHGGGCVYAASFALGGLLVTLSARWERRFSALGFLCGTLTVTLWSHAVIGSFLPFWNAVLGCALWLAAPQRLLDRVELPLPAPAASQPLTAATPVEDELRGRLRRQSAAFRTLHDQLHRDLAAAEEPPTDGFELLRRASGRVCPGCVFRTGCWKRELAATKQMLRPAAEQMARQGRADPMDFPGAFSARCSRLNELVNAANQEYAAEQTRRRYRLRLLEGRKDICRQYGRIARLLEDSASSLEPRAVPVMTATTRLTALAGVAAGKRPGQSVSGDAGGWFRDDEGVLWVVLCDGMGSGAEAARDSRFAYKLLEQFLSAGISPEVALATIGSALALRWESSGSFTTIDLLQLDLMNGEGVSYKLGAAPTYLRRGGVLSRITSSTLPAGLQQDHQPDISRFRLGPGDLAVLVSDGVTDGGEDGWVRRQIREFQGDSPKELAGSLLRHEQPATDDRTAIVLHIGGALV